MAIYLDDEGSTALRPEGPRLRHPATTRRLDDRHSRTTSSGAAAATTRAPCRRPKWHNRAKNAAGDDGAAVRTSYETFRNPGPTCRASTSTVTTDAGRAAHAAPRTGTAATRASPTRSSTSTATGAGRADARLLDLVLHRGGLGLRLRRGQGRRRVGDRAARERRAAPRSRRTRTRTATTPRATASPAPPAARTSSTSRHTSHLTATLPAGTTDVRFRYSTDAAYLDTGWFVDDVRVGGAAGDASRAEATGSRPTGSQDNNWVAPGHLAVRPDARRHLDRRDGGRGRLPLPLRGRPHPAERLLDRVPAQLEALAHGRDLEPADRRHRRPRRGLRLPPHQHRERQNTLATWRRGGRQGRSPLRHCTLTPTHFIGCDRATPRPRAPHAPAKQARSSPLARRIHANGDSSAKIANSLNRYQVLTTWGCGRWDAATSAHVRLRGLLGFSVRRGDGGGSGGLS